VAEHWHILSVDLVCHSNIIQTSDKCWSMPKLQALLYVHFVDGVFIASQFKKSIVDYKETNNMQILIQPSPRSMRANEENA